MKIEKVHLITEMSKDEVRYKLKLTDMPDNITNCFGEKIDVDMIYYMAYITVSGGCIKNWEIEAVGVNGRTYGYFFQSDEERMNMEYLFDKFISRIAPVFPVLSINSRYSCLEYETLVKSTVKLSYIPSPLMTFKVPFGVKYQNGIVSDVRKFPDNTLFTTIEGRRFKANGKIYTEKGYLSNPTVAAIKDCWPSQKIDNDIPQTYTFIVSSSEQLTDYSGKALKERIENCLKSGSVSADDICKLLEKYNEYFNVCDDIIKIFTKQPEK